VNRDFYARLAPDAGTRTLVDRFVIPRRSGRAWPVRAGQIFRILALEGPQVADLNVWSQTDEDSRRLTVVPAGDKVQVTGLARGPWAQVARGDRLGWVHKAYLARSKPAAGITVSGHVSGAPCPDGSAVESGLHAHTIEVYRAVCAAFPAVTTWGGLSGSGGDHGAGMALDIMCTGSLGDAISAYVRAHASALGVSYVIWSQHIWTVQRSSEGWRLMPDRGSTTANHYDHVHVSVY